MLRVALLVPDGFATFSFTPLAAFEVANLVLGKRFYDIHITSAEGGRVASSLGMEVDTECVADSAFDTLLVGSHPDVMQPSQRLVSFLRGAPTNTRRIASSSGADIRRQRWRLIGSSSPTGRSGRPPA